MNDPSRMTVIDSIDQLEHEELDLVGSDGSLVFRHILFEIVVQVFEN